MAASGAGTARHAPPAAYRRAVAALATEWIKLRSLRSMLLTPLLGAVAFIVLAAGQARNNAANYAHFDAVQRAQFDPLVINFNFVVIGVLLFGAHAPHVSLGDHHVLAHLLGTVYYLTAAGLIGLFTGVLVRSAAAAITSMFGFLLLLPVLADRITADVVTRHTVPYLPTNLGTRMLQPQESLSPGAAVAGLAAWVLVLAAAAAFSLRGRDA